MKNKTLISGISLAVFSILFVFLFLEIILRLNDITGVFKLPDINTRTIGIYHFDKDLGWKYRPNTKLRYKTGAGRTIEESINEHGWRDYLYPYKKGKDTYRIAVLGCSFTYGYGENAESSYPKILESILKQKYGNIEVLNFGVNGYGLDQAVINYFKNVAAYSPDLVLVQLNESLMERIQYKKIFLTNKPVFAEKNNKIVIETNHISAPKTRADIWFRKHSFLYRFVRHQLLIVESKTKRSFAGYVYENKKSKELLVKILEHLNTSAQKHDTRVIAFNWDTAEYNHIAKMVAKQAAIEFIDLREIEDYSEWEKNGSMLNETRHWSEHGNRYVASALFKYLDEILEKIF